METRQLAIILALEALCEITFEQMETHWEKGSTLRILDILSQDFKHFLHVASSIQYFHFNIFSDCSDGGICRSQSEQYKWKLK